MTEAYVTLATNDKYALGALVLAHSLRRVNTTRQIVALITPSVSESLRLQMSNVFNEVLCVDVMDSNDSAHLALLKRPELGVTFTKLHCWTLTQFSKCVFLDADMLAVQNSDELFEQPELSGVPDIGWPDCFNSGLFVFSPSQDTYARLLQHAEAVGSFDGGDQGLLNTFFTSWNRLSFIYNMVASVTYTYLPAYKQYGKDVKFVHFLGTTKPWQQSYHSSSGTVVSQPGQEHVSSHLNMWWHLFATHIKSELEESVSKVSSPLLDIVSSGDEYKLPMEAHEYEPITYDTHSTYHTNVHTFEQQVMTKREGEDGYSSVYESHSHPHYEPLPTPQSPQPHYEPPPTPQSPQPHYEPPPTPQSPQPHYEPPPTPQSPQPHYEPPPTPQSPQHYYEPPTPQSPHYYEPPTPQSPQPHYERLPISQSTQPYQETQTQESVFATFEHTPKFSSVLQPQTSEEPPVVEQLPAPEPPVPRYSPPSEAPSYMPVDTSGIHHSKDFTSRVSDSSSQATSALQSTSIVSSTAVVHPPYGHFPGYRPPAPVSNHTTKADTTTTSPFFGTTQTNHIRPFPTTVVPELRHAYPSESSPQFKDPPRRKQDLWEGRSGRVPIPAQFGSPFQPFLSDRIPSPFSVHRTATAVSAKLPPFELSEEMTEMSICPEDSLVEHKKRWEEGRPDFRGKDSFDNILAHIQSKLSEN